MDDLIERLESAPEGSRELDAEIELDRRKFIAGAAAFVGWAANPDLGKGKVLGWIWDGEHVNSQDEAPHYTTSVDAALTLVPEGWAIEGAMIWPGHPISLKLLETHLEGGRYWHDSDDGSCEIQAATLALAICIAALKARREP